MPYMASTGSPRWYRAPPLPSRMRSLISSSILVTSVRDMPSGRQIAFSIQVEQRVDSGATGPRLSIRTFVGRTGERVSVSKASPTEKRSWRGNLNPGHHGDSIRDGPIGKDHG